MMRVDSMTGDSGLLMGPDNPRVLLINGPFDAPTRVIELERPMTVSEVIDREQLTFRLPTIAVLIDGDESYPVLRKDWAEQKIVEGSVLAFVAVPGGGGQGDSGKQIAMLVAMLALTVAAPFIGPALGFAAGSLGASIASAAFLVGGSLLLNAIMAKAKTPSEGKVDQVYIANAASNSADPLGTIPCLYGRMRYPPPFASRPYSEFEGNEQFLYQLFCITVGTAEVEKIELADTAAWNEGTGFTGTFEDMAIEVIKPGEPITLFPAGVVTAIEVANLELTTTDWVGPFVVNDAGTFINRVKVDFAFPGGLFVAADQGGVEATSVRLQAQYREIDDLGDPVGLFIDIFDQTYTYKTRTPQRRTKRTGLIAEGRYEVRFRRITAIPAPSENKVDVVAWISLAGYIADFVVPPNCTLLAIRIMANEQLSEAAARQINVTSIRKLPVFNGTVFSAPAETQSIAWAAADLLRNTDYGLSLTDGQYDLATLFALSSTWSSRGDTFNAVFDRKWTASDALFAILRCGRTQPIRLGGLVGFVRDQSRDIQRFTFTPRNVVKGSFTHKLVLFDEEKPDHVIGRYLSGITYKEQDVVASLSSVGEAEPQIIEYFGIDNHNQAWREAVTDAAANAYRREFVGFESELEGKLLVRGDPVLILHPFIEQVALASILDRDADTLTVDRDLATVSSPHVIIRTKGGREWGPCIVDSQPTPRTLILNTADRIAVAAEHGALTDILPDEREEHAHLLLCQGTARPFNGLIVSAVPSGNRRVRVLCVNDAPEVHAADGTETMPSPWVIPDLPPPIITRPIITGFYATLRVAVAGVELEAMWNPAAGADRYRARVSYDEGESYTPLWNGIENRFTKLVLPQPMRVQVSARGVMWGPWVTAEFEDADVPDRVIGSGTVWPGALEDQLKHELDLVTQDMLGSVRRRIDEAVDLIEDAIAGNIQEVLLVNEQRKILLNLVAKEGDDRRAAILIVGEAYVTADEAVANLVAVLRTDWETNNATVTLALNSVSGVAGAAADLAAAVEAKTNRGTANGILDLRAISAPAGVTARFRVGLSTTTPGNDVVTTGLYLDILPNQTSRLLLDVDRLFIGSVSQNTSPFFIDGNNVYIKRGNVQVLNAAQINADAIETYHLHGRMVSADNIIFNGLETAHLKLQSVSIAKKDDASNTITIPANSGVYGGVQLSFAYTAGVFLINHTSRVRFLEEDLFYTYVAYDRNNSGAWVVISDSFVTYFQGVASFVGTDIAAINHEMGATFLWTPPFANSTYRFRIYLVRENDTGNSECYRRNLGVVYFQR